jgi:hypothetical protein
VVDAVVVAEGVGGGRCRVDVAVDVVFDDVVVPVATPQWYLLWLVML